MSFCKKVKRWVTEKIQVPVERAIKEARRLCERVKKRIEEKVSKPVEKWISKQERKCKRRKCKWWCACCNKWLCWFVTVVVKVVSWVIITVVKWVTYWVCKTVMVVVEIVVKIVIRTFKFLVTFTVCIFTDPLEALKSLWEYWKDLLDIVDDIFDILKGFIYDALELIGDVKRLNCSLVESFGWPGRVLLGFVGGVLNVGSGLVGVVCDFFSGLKDIALGILNLNGCKISGGLTNIGSGLGRGLVTALGSPGWVLASGIKYNVHIKRMKEIIDEALQAAFGDDEDRIERIKDEMRFDSCPMGLPVRIDARRMCIPSGEYLRELHKRGSLDLYALAGQINGCAGEKWATETTSVVGEVVYNGTDIRVSYFDIKRFLEEGAEAVPAFSVYPIKLERYEHFLQIAREKGYQLGVEFSWDEIRDYQIDGEFDPEMQFVPMQQFAHDRVFTNYPRNGVDDPLCDIPALAVFQYFNNRPKYGLTSWFRPPPYDNPCAVPSDNMDPYIRRSGVSFTDRIPEFVFGTVLIHEIGHYLGLCHEGHDGLEFIMYSPEQSESSVTTNTALQYLILSGGPAFTLDNVKETWRWLTQVASRTCLFP